MALLLRPKESDGGNGGPPSSGHLPTFGVGDDLEDQQVGHDPNTLPHLHSLQEMRRLFPVLGAPPVGVSVDDWEPETDEMQEVRGREPRSTKEVSSRGSCLSS